ncbi:MAG: sigma-70 family RNA polymerase sigma factor [Saprospiraceae bacterium]|nr:sigma-70 family RNA polymerase sigma factor [Saprospiraceae bacterium]
MSIEDIIQGCKEGNRTCQDALVQKFAPGLLALCLRYTSDRELAKDALQECFINAFKYLYTFQGKGSFEGWLKRIAVTCTLTLHKKYHRVYFNEEGDADVNMIATIPDIYSTLGKEEIMSLLKELPESQYLVFNLYVIEGYVHGEIAEMLGINESTSRSALCKARTKLIELIKKQQEVFLVQSTFI